MIEDIDVWVLEASMISSFLLEFSFTVLKSVSYILNMFVILALPNFVLI